MVDAEAMKQAIAPAAVEAVKAMVVAVTGKTGRQAMGASHQNTAEIVRLLTGGPSLRQPVFDWSTSNKYKELKKLKMEVTRYS